MTFKQVDIKAENMAKALIKKKFCPIIQSNINGTPDLKFMAIFSENRVEWVIT